MLLSLIRLFSNFIDFSCICDISMCLNLAMISIVDIHTSFNNSWNHMSYNVIISLIFAFFWCIRNSSSKMSWNSQMEVHYPNHAMPYNSIGSFVDYFGGLTYDHGNFIFADATYVQVHYQLFHFEGH